MKYVTSSQLRHDVAMTRTQGARSESTDRMPEVDSALNATLGTLLSGSFEEQAAVLTDAIAGAAVGVRRLCTDQFAAAFVAAGAVGDYESGALADRAPWRPGNGPLGETDEQQAQLATLEMIAGIRDQASLAIRILLESARRETAPTTRQLAQAAKISRATVSRWLNSPISGQAEG